MSTGALYPLDLNTHSGARYHLVDTYSVYGGADLVSLISPKSEILSFKSSVINILSGFKSRWKKLLFVNVFDPNN